MRDKTIVLCAVCGYALFGDPSNYDRYEKTEYALCATCYSRMVVEDEKRQKAIEKSGVHFLRFEDIEVKKNMSNVPRVIEAWIEKNQTKTHP
jgi:hypothetical protein